MNSAHSAALASAPPGGQWMSHRSTWSVPRLRRLCSSVRCALPASRGGSVVVRKTSSRGRPLSCHLGADGALLDVPARQHLVAGVLAVAGINAVGRWVGLSFEGPIVTGWGAVARSEAAPSRCRRAWCGTARFPSWPR